MLISASQRSLFFPNSEIYSSSFHSTCKKIRIILRLQINLGNSAGLVWQCLPLLFHSLHRLPDLRYPWQISQQTCMLDTSPHPPAPRSLLTDSWLYTAVSVIKCAGLYCTAKSVAHSPICTWKRKQNARKEHRYFISWHSDAIDIYSCKKRGNRKTLSSSWNPRLEAWDKYILQFYFSVVIPSQKATTQDMLCRAQLIYLVL